ncbi:quinoprotein ethanol dehydrogenase [Gemmatimonadetes bacterium T265]|nr:quinoprotein ethanol dehydrogenase [Gemmatimonadetes bacterium T265]
MPSFRRSLARVAALAGVLPLAGCQYLQFASFLKRPDDPRPRGHHATTRGPAFSTPLARTAVDPAADWPAYNGPPTGTRYSPLAEITTANVATLRPTCTAALGERTAMQSGPVVVAGVLYVTSATRTWAIDAATCALRWSHRYDYRPKPDYDLKTNRGVAYLDTPDGPRLFRGANDGRVYALNARTGEEVWNVRAGDVALGETFPAAPVAWRGLVYLGNAGGDNYGVVGRIMAFDVRTGARVWSTPLIPRAGAAAATWPAETDRTPRTGATTWTSYTIDTLRGLLYVPTGNAGPDFQDADRPGTNLHTYSVVALDLATGELRRAWQLLSHDFHDWDVAAAPLLLTTAGGTATVAVAGKDGHVYGLLEGGGRRFATPTTTLQNGDAPLTPAGTRFCPGVQGGTEWNGPAYAPGPNLLYVGAVDWCTTVRIEPPERLKGKVGIPWTGSARLLEPFGHMDPRDQGRGWLTAVDADDGAVRWRYASPTPLVAGVLATAGGLVFTADLVGNVLAFDARSGAERWRTNTGQPIGGGVVSYGVAGRQYLAVASGLHAPLTWMRTSSEATVVVYALP